MKKCAALIIEDDEELRRLLLRILGQHCTSVEVSGDGESAIEMLSGGSFDLVLLDLMLPKRNGFEVFQVIQNLPQPPRVIVLSAISRHFIDRFPEEIVVLQKPFDLDRLQTVLSE